jgi:hypothetical protein
MRIRLSDYGSSFATRARAREIVALADVSGAAIELDLSGVMATPSFLAEILVAVVELGAVSLISEQPDSATFISAARLAEQLGLGNRVKPMMFA